MPAADTLPSDPAILKAVIARLSADVDALKREQQRTKSGRFRDSERDIRHLTADDRYMPERVKLWRGWQIVDVRADVPETAPLRERLIVTPVIKELPVGPGFHSGKGVAHWYEVGWKPLDSIPRNDASEPICPPHELERLMSQRRRQIEGLESHRMKLEQATMQRDKDNAIIESVRQQTQVLQALFAEMKGTANVNRPQPDGKATAGPERVRRTPDRENA